MWWDVLWDNGTLTELQDIMVVERKLSGSRAPECGVCAPENGVTTFTVCSVREERSLHAPFKLVYSASSKVAAIYQHHENTVLTECVASEYALLERSILPRNMKDSHSIVKIFDQLLDNE